MNPKFSVSLVAMLALLCVCAFAADGSAGVIGTWNGTPDGWINWGNTASIDDAVNMPGKYEYATLGGDPALKVTHSGWNQNLSIKLQDNGLIGDFLANSIFKINLTVPETTEAGWTKIESIGLNAQGAGFGAYSVSEPALFGWGDGGGGAQSATLEFDYSGYLNDIVPTLDLGEGQPWWAEIIITTNNDSVHTEFLFQNARLVPEPTSLVLMGLALVGLVFCRRH